MTAQTAARLSDVPLEGCRLLILDFDGVITRLEVDWRAIKKEAARICRDELGLDTAFSPVASGREHVLREAGAGALARIDAFLADREMEGLGSARLSPEVAGLLAAHPALPLAIFSANSRRVLDGAIVKFGLDGRVTAIAGREDVSRLKPHPEGLLKVLAAAGCDPSRAIYVGDREIDALAGEAAGVPTYVVSPGEPGRLESIAAGHSYDEGFNGRLTRYRALAIRRLVPRGGELLEIGPAGGALAAAIADHFSGVTLVEASATYLDEARRRLGARARYHQTLIESFETDRRFDCVLASGILEHVEDPVAVARRAAGWLAPQGLAVFIVPNARSLHRRIGLSMGMISRLDELQAHDLEVGHRRYYDRESLNADVARAGLEVVREDGIFLKPLANSQMESWDEKLADAFYEVGREMPDWCAEIVAVCRRRAAPR